MSDGRWRTQVEAVAHANPWFQVLRQGVVRPDGSLGTHYTIHHERPAVGVVARRDGRYLLIRQHRFIVDRMVWAIPSGAVGPGEAPIEAARRELREEAALLARSLAPLPDYFPSYGCSDQRFELFLAQDPDPSGEPLDAAEVIDAAWFEEGRVRRMIEAGEIVDGLSLVPLMHLLLFRPPSS